MKKVIEKENQSHYFDIKCTHQKGVWEGNEVGFEWQKRIYWRIYLNNVKLERVKSEINQIKSKLRQIRANWNIWEQVETN